jgi:hypothetical protein
MFADQLRRAVEASPRVELARVAQLLWKAYAAGHVSEAEAAGLSNLIEARKAVPATQRPAQRRFGSRPRTHSSVAPEAPAVGRVWSLAASPCEPVHHGRERRPGCRVGRSPPTRGLHADGRPHRRSRGRVRDDGAQCRTRSAGAQPCAGRGAPDLGLAQQAQPDHGHVARMADVAATTDQGGRVHFSKAHAYTRE